MAYEFEKQSKYPINNVQSDSDIKKRMAMRALYAGPRSMREMKYGTGVENDKVRTERS